MLRETLDPSEAPRAGPPIAAAPETVPQPRPRLGKVFAVSALMVTLPALVYYLWLCIADHDGALFFPASAEDWQTLLYRLPGPTTSAVLVFVGWFLLQALFQIAAPGKIHEGSVLADGLRLKYKMNGWMSFWASLAFIGAVVSLGWLSPTFVYDQFGPLLTTANLFAFAFSLFLYIHGRTPKGDDRITGNFLYDYFMGVRLNPRIGGFDFKFFCESRPGLIGWVVVNFALAAKQYELHAALTTPMLLVLAFHFLYVADYFWHEEAILTTWDIKHERFGWMLCWGDLVWVPFTYSLQAHYLVGHPHELPVWGTIGIVLLNLTGYVLFRGANWQKHRFRKDPEALVWGKKPTSIRTSQGALLLTSGWWGIARHVNYLGDLLMGLAWCLPCLFDHVVPYFYIIYFTILLVHRERRDDAKCRAKYGADWDAYCGKVPWRILPGVY